jgi:hypothetical protein
MFLLHYYPKSIFGEYNVRGIKKVKNEIIDYLARSFKNDTAINVSFTENEIIVEGAREKLRQLLSVMDTEPKKSVEIKRTEMGFLPSTLKAKSAYLIDVAELGSVLDSDEVRFEYNNEGITATVKSTDETTEYNKKIVPIRTEGNESGKAIISSDLLSRVLDTLAGQVWLIFTEEPVVVSYTDGEKVLSYVLATMAEV